MRKGFKKGYKVVRKSHGRLLSITRTKHPTVYLLERFVEREKGCGPLGVFKDFPAALSFARSWRHSRVYFCEYAPSKAKGFWSKYSEFRPTYRQRFMIVQRGADCANSVKLIHRAIED